MAVNGVPPSPDHSGIEGSVSIDDLIANLELESEWSEAFAESRKEIAAEVGAISKLAELRLARGLSQRRLAELSGCSQPQLARLERGKGNPSIGTLRRVASALSVTIESAVSAFEAARRQ